MSQSTATSLLTNAGFAVDTQFISAAGAPTALFWALPGPHPRPQVTLRFRRLGGGSGGGATSGGQGASGPNPDDEPIVLEVPGLAPITISPPR